jgi:lipoyl(octanoyl) transferase
MLISTCGRFNLKTETNEHTGIWVKNRKIAALGVQIQRHITSHGFALNCDTDLTWFDHIIPCGLVGYGVTSLTKEVGISKPNVTVTQVIPELIECFEKTFDAEMVDDPIRNQTIDDFINKQLIEHCGELVK